MGTDQVTSIGIFILCIFLSAFFSSSETAFTSANQHRLKNQAEEGNRQAQQAEKLINQYEQLLSTILIGNNLVNILSSAVATLFFVQLFPIYGATISTIVTTIILLIFGEITPKLVAKLFPEKLAKQFSGILTVLNKLFSPVVWVLSQWQRLVIDLLPVKNSPSISEDELLTMLNVAKSEGTLEDDEHDLVRAAIRFDDTEVSQIITPRIDIDGIDIESSFEEIDQVFEQTNHTRLAVYDGTIDELIGTIHERDFNRLLKRHANHPESNKDLRSIISKPHYVPITMLLSDLLQFMQLNKVHLSYVIDEFGSIQGIVTMEDILERLVGDIWDEHDQIELELTELEPQQKIQVSGLMTLEDLYDYFDKRYEGDWDSSTVSGLVMELIHRMPEVGDCVEIDQLKITVESIDNGRVMSALVELI
ncbi:HlyC/CorC family transporter [Falseniella ignava]|uniref:HlyC/CorC family transporter n=1 Tax=Falseniella ignava TaxID=137730 RepID=A0A2I1JW27_9LACT|nr:hemolysin family protein [Falseniella ignava]PKY87581.1 HlyC/CorC family transporter [Falseniella ignava]